MVETREKSCKTYIEDLADGGLKTMMPLEKILFAGESEFQEVEILETWFGKTLVTDGKTQSALLDEATYHEALVHPAMLKARTCKNVFIGGGGELATAREVLRHKSVERLVMVDIDETVVRMCEEHLPEWGQGATKDPRMDLIFGDAHAWLMNTHETFDVIIMDISDPIEAGPGICLYTKEFYEHVVTKLNPGGIFVTQAGIAEAAVLQKYPETTCWGPIYKTLSNVFSCVIPYHSQVFSFGGHWGFVMAFNGSEKEKKEWKNPEEGKIDKLIEDRIIGGADSFSFYDGETHLNLMSLSKISRNALEKDVRVMTIDNPVFMY